MIKDRLGQTMFGTNTWYTRQAVSNLSDGSSLTYNIEFPMNLGSGSYSISTDLVSTDTHLVDNYEWRDLAYVFNVINIDKVHFIGNSLIHPHIKVQLV